MQVVVQVAQATTPYASEVQRVSVRNIYTLPHLEDVESWPSTASASARMHLWVFLSAPHVFVATNFAIYFSLGFGPLRLRGRPRGPSLINNFATLPSKTPLGLRPSLPPNRLKLATQVVSNVLTGASSATHQSHSSHCSRCLAPTARPLPPKDPSATTSTSDCTT